VRFLFDPSHQRGLLTTVSLMKITVVDDYGQAVFIQWAILSQCQTQKAV